MKACVAAVVAMAIILRVYGPNDVSMTMCLYYFIFIVVFNGQFTSSLYV
jgi:hypothetical protein